MGKTTSIRQPRASRDRLWMNELLRYFVKVPGQHVTVQVEDTICGLIAQGLLQPGDRLPSLTQLAEVFDVDTYSINLAYQRLQEQGITSSKDRSGSFVASAGAVHARVGGMRLSDAITACRRMEMTEREILSVFREQLKRHFDVQKDKQKRRSDVDGSGTGKTGTISAKNGARKKTASKS
jgi:DNA-binding transcriptional regulator YhcF (GntR family)